MAALPLSPRTGPNRERDANRDTPPLSPPSKRDVSSALEASRQRRQRLNKPPLQNKPDLQAEPEENSQLIQKQEDEEIEVDIDAMIKVATEAIANPYKPQHSNDSLLLPPEVILPDTQLQKKEAQVYITYSAEPLQLSGPGGTPFIPRKLEEEGLFVGVKPPVTETNERRMQHRLFKEGSIQWFGFDGKIANEPIPLKPLYERPGHWYNPEAPYMKTVIRDADDPQLIEMEVESLFEVKIKITGIHFYDHPLFNQEDLMATQLMLLYEEFLERQDMKLVEFYSEKLQAFEEQLVQLKNPPPKNVNPTKQRLMERSVSFRTVAAGPSVIDEAAQAATKMKELREKIRKTRLLRDEEEAADLLLVRKMISLWKDIVDLRTSQGFHSTTVKLLIRKEASDVQKDTDRLRQQLESELGELREDHQARFTEELEKYNADMKVYLLKKQLLDEQQEINQLVNESQQEKNEDSLVRKTKDPEKEEDGLSEDEDPGEVQPDPKQEAPEVAPQIAPPLIPVYQEFDEEGHKAAIVERYKKTKRKPGKPRQIPKVLEADTPTETGACPPEEQSRRGEIERNCFFLKLFINNKHVTKTPLKTLPANFRVELDEAFLLQLVKWPESIKVQVCTQPQKKQEVILAEVDLKAPLTPTSEILKFPFQGPFKFHPPWLANASDDHFATGFITASIIWGRAPDGTTRIPPVPKHKNLGLDDNSSCVMMRVAESTQKLKEWLSLDVDPNDPRNSNILHLLKKTNPISIAQVRDACSFHRQQQDLFFDVEMGQDKRHKLLKMRDESHLDVTVPMMDTYITSSMLKTQDDTPLEDIVPAVSQHATRAFLKEVRENTRQQVLIAKQNTSIRLQDVITPYPISTFVFGDFITRLFRPRRQLRPERKERKPVTVMPSEVKKCDLLVQLIRGFNVPTRKTQKNLDEGLAPFVEMVFQDKHIRTRESDGANPQWNETLIFPFVPPGNDFSARNLAVVADVIYFNLFDEVLVSLPKDDRKRDEIHLRRERRWLGSFSIPFSAIYQNVKVEGVFRVRKPLLSMTHNLEGSNELSQYGITTSTDTTISIYCTLNPPLQRPEPQLDENMPTREDADVIRYALNWVQDLTKLKQCQNRAIQAISLDITGRTSLITRYIRKQKPPSALKDIPSLVRFVSLVPYLADAVTFIGKSNVWNTSKQFLEMRAGDWEEHAILLCNYLLSMNKDAYVVLGTGTEGEAAYALLREDGKQTLYHAITGEAYSPTDVNIPLRNIGCVFNDKNIWANIQTVNELFRLKYELNDKNQWTPFFSERFPPRTLDSLQVESLNYKETTEAFLKNLTAEIEEAIVEAIKNTRNFIIRWQRNLNKVLQGLLPLYEAAFVTGETKRAEEETHRELAKFQSSYRINGFPINVPYTDAEEVVRAVMKTRIQQTDNDKTEFAVAVHVNGYPNNVCSVWVFLAACEAIT